MKTGVEAVYTGIDIGGTKCTVVKGNSCDGIVEKIRFDTTDVEETLKNIFEAVEKLGNTKAIGISCGGPLNSRKGIIMSPPNLPGWDNIHICDMLRDRFNVPAGLQNDANACALAEWKYGAGRNTRNMIFLTFGTGLGAGLILNGRLYSGTNDMAGEVGHIRLSEFGPVGYGKSGSFEGFCSGGGIAGLGRLIAEEWLQAGRKTAFCKSYDDLDKINAKLIAECAKNGDEAAKKVYNICAEKLGTGLSILIDILNPERIVIGSIFERSENLLREGMQKVIEKEALKYSKDVCEIVPAELGDSIGDWAAIAVAQNCVCEDV
ncbi:MAG: ROK family protein [Oscillospiraceae bacterium]|nr:ROK family protein [Oscillospiraceae bacterium]